MTQMGGACRGHAAMTVDLDPDRNGRLTSDIIGMRGRQSPRAGRFLAAMRGLPPEERLRRLERMARSVLEMAVGTGDWRAAAFVADQMRRGCHPARSLV